MEVLNGPLDRLKQDFQSSLIKTIVPCLDLQLAEAIALVRALHQNQLRFESEIKGGTPRPAEVAKRLSLAQMALFSGNGLADFKPSQFEAWFPGFETELKGVLDSYPDQIRTVQSRDRFYSLPGDGSWVRFRKRLKRYRLGWQRFKNRALNLFRSPKKAPPEWKQEIPFHGIVLYWGLGEYANALLDCVLANERLIQETLCSIHASLEKNEERIMEWVKDPVDDPKLEPISAEPLEAGAKTLPETLTQTLDRAYSRLSALIARGGTFEFPSRKISDSRLYPTVQKQRAPGLASVNRWRKSLLALLSWWETQSRLSGLAFGALAARETIAEQIETKLSGKILPLIAQTQAHIEGFYAQTMISASTQDFGRLLESIREENQRSLVQTHLPEIEDCLEKANLTLTLIRPLREMEGLLPASQNKVIREGELPVRNKQIEMVNLRELLEFSTLLNLPKVMGNVQAELTDYLDGFRSRIAETGEVIDFNLDTALNLVGQEGESLHTAHETASEGLKRAAKNIADAGKDLEEKLNTLRDLEGQELVRVASRIFQIRNPKTLFEVRAGLLESMAIEGWSVYRLRVLNFARSGVLKVFQWFKQVAASFRKNTLALSRWVGLGDPEGQITTQISDFLAESDLALKRLPKVYQRLFRAEAVSDNLLFLKRSSSEAAFYSALANWQQGRYAPTLIVGESGSGRTSFIQKMCTSCGFQGEVIMITPSERIQTSAELSALLSHHLNLTSSNHTADLIQEIQGQQSPRLVVLENLEQCFLKRVGGFEAIQVLMQVVSETNQQIFWVFSISLYTNDFLNKTIGLKEVVPYTIILNDFDSTDIEEIILKRHRLSGFNLQFHPSEEDAKRAAYKKATTKERQAYLKAIYFQDLKAYAENNLSLALLFWTRSALEVGKREILMGSLKDIDLSFIENLAPDKVMSLHILVLHGAMTASAFGSVTGEGETGAKRTLLRLADVGILVQEQGRFRVNPLLFRSTIYLLETQNFIH